MAFFRCWSIVLNSNLSDTASQDLQIKTDKIQRRQSKRGGFMMIYLLSESWLKDTLFLTTLLIKTRQPKLPRSPLWITPMQEFIWSTAGTVDASRVLAVHLLSHWRLKCSHFVLCTVVAEGPRLRQSRQEGKHRPQASSQQISLPWRLLFCTSSHWGDYNLDKDGVTANRGGEIF